MIRDDLLFFFTVEETIQGQINNKNNNDQKNLAAYSLLPQESRRVEER